jgi:hypothetical protein
VRVTHPFHPWSRREFVFVAVRQTWAEDRVFFLDAEGNTGGETRRTPVRIWRPSG